MFGMKKYLLPLFCAFALVFVLSACTSARTVQQRFVGSWKETWGVGQETDVKYNDVYVIGLVSGSGLSVACPEKKQYRPQNVEQDGNRLSFRLEIRDDKYATGGSHVDYKLNLQRDRRTLEGTATTNEGKQFNIRWDKTQ